jgi:hypothetical protein
MEMEIKSSRADLVSMPGKLLRHPRPKDGLASRVMKYASVSRVCSVISITRFEDGS